MVGDRIKRARLAKNLTLKEIERKAKVSATHVSEIERGLTSPTVGALARIAAALETPAFRLLEGGDGARVSVTRAAERTVLADVGCGGRYHRLSGGFAGAELSLVEIELDAGGTRGAAPLEHPGEEFFHVLRGVVELTVDDATRQREVLKEGDSIHLGAHPGREIRNIGDGTARVLWAIAPPIHL
jgi:quercetin dioxygenase-like cupin family protein